MVMIKRSVMPMDVRERRPKYTTALSKAVRESGSRTAWSDRGVSVAETIMIAMQTDGVDVDWVREQLTDYIGRTRPVNQSHSGSGYTSITARTAPECGRAAAIDLTETVRPILDRLYLDWRSENDASKNDEFKIERDACRRLLARLENLDEVERRLGGRDTSPRITAASLHPLIWTAAKAQWSTGHRHEAVLAASKAVNSQLQAKVSRRDVSEADLVRQAFSERGPAEGKPRLRFLHIEDEQTRESMRQGAMNFGAGCFAAIRNPVGHLPNDQV